METQQQAVVVNEWTGGALDEPRRPTGLEKRLAAGCKALRNRCRRNLEVLIIEDAGFSRPIGHKWADYDHQLRVLIISRSGVFSGRHVEVEGTLVLHRTCTRSVVLDRPYTDDELELFMTVGSRQQNGDKTTFSGRIVDECVHEIVKAELLRRALEGEDAFNPVGQIEAAISGVMADDD